MSSSRIVTGLLLVGASTICWSDSALAGTSINVEAVSDYTFFSGGGTGNNTQCTQEGLGFYNAMTAAGTGWTTGQYWPDSQVWDTDFFDPDLTGTAADSDQLYFDHPAVGISLFCGHGICNDAYVRSCVHDSDCLAGSYCPGGTAPGTNMSRTCISQTTRVMLTSSPSSSHGNFVTYGTNYGSQAAKSMAFGESANNGWGGVGTNGGMNIGVIINSCGFRSRYVDSETTYMFSGVHSLFLAMPTNAEIPTNTGGFQPPIYYSDTADWVARGSTLASNILSNQNAAAGDAWATPTMANNGFAVTGGGIPNNGANIVLAKDAYLSRAQFHTNSETWIMAQSDAYDSLGLGYVWYRYACNYDCNALGL